MTDTLSQILTPDSRGTGTPAGPDAPEGGYGWFVLRTLLTRRWLGGLALALAFAVACFFLGRWQYTKHVAHLEMAEAVTTHYAAAPVPLDQALATPAAVLTGPAEWTRVSVTGRYAGDARLIVRNRPLEGTYGVEVLVPLRTAGGVLFVDRGWVPFGETAAAVPHTPDPPTGEVTVTGWLRSPEPDLGRDLPPGQLASINIDEARAATGLEPAYQAYLVMGEENPSAATRPAPLAQPDTDLGPHQAYAIQWWAAMLAAPLFVFFGVRAESRREARLAEGREEPAAPARPKKVRIWDEEDG